MGFKDKIRNNFWGKYAISLLHCVECHILPKMVSDKEAIIKNYKKETGKFIDLDNPVTFSEKLQWYKLNYKDPTMAVCADKYAVREYIINKGYGSILNELYGVFDNVKDINLDILPENFVLKASHGSGQNIIVKDKNKLNWKRAKLLLDSWLKQDIYWGNREWVYKDMPRHIIAEKYLEDETGELRDYKFFCFNGKPTYMQLEIGRYSGEHIRNFYDMDWNLMPFGKAMPHNNNVKIDKPSQFESMKKIATDLSKEFQFVRVDLYSCGDKIYFGELTFFPAGGANDFIPSEYDKIVGLHWNVIK